MKILRITESQYKKLIKNKNLINEQVIYNDIKDEKDVHSEMGRVLDSIAYNLYGTYKKPLYIKKIDKGVVYIDKSKYNEEEIKFIESDIEFTVVGSNLSIIDKPLTDPNELGFDSGKDADYVWKDEEERNLSSCYCMMSNGRQISYKCGEPLPRGCEDNNNNNNNDNNDILTTCFCVNPTTKEKVEYKCGESLPEECNKKEEEVIYEPIDISYCDYGMNGKGQKRKFVPPPSMDIKFYQDILKSIGANITCQKMLFFYAWRTGEASLSSYNPFATTYKDIANEGCYYNCLKSGVGYKPIGCRECPSGTNPGVRNYKTYKSGLNATVKTLTNGRYNNVVRKLKNDNITAEEIASEIEELTTWGTGGLVHKVLYSTKTINPKPITKYGDVPKYVLPDDMNCKDCVNNELTIKHDNHINDENVKDFRWWVNQDNNRLKSVTDKLKECCETKSDPTLSPTYNKKNDHTIIAFSVVGNEWVNAGKPKSPEENKVGDVVFLPPNKKGWNQRGRDCYGSGSYGAPRSHGTHKGVDIKSDEGDIIVSPIDGYISNSGYRVYSNKCSYLIGIDVTGTGEYSGYTVRLFYVKGTVPLNKEVKKGDPIGIQQSLQKNCYPKMENGKYCMTNHVHVELYVNGSRVNPTKYNWGSGSSSSKSPNEEENKKPTPKPKKGGSITKPTGAISTSLPQANRWGKPHHGYDIVGPYPGNTCLIVCNKPGVVTNASRCGTYGKLVEIRHNDGTYSAYAHLHKIHVTLGQTINVGDVIGVEGNTGGSFGRHLHFEERVPRPKKLKNRCGEGSPYNEVYGYGNVKPISNLNNYFYFQKAE